MVPRLPLRALYSNAGQCETDCEVVIVERESSICSIVVQPRASSGPDETTASRQARSTQGPRTRSRFGRLRLSLRSPAWRISELWCDDVAQSRAAPLMASSGRSGDSEREDND